MNKDLNELIEFISNNNDINDKAKLTNLVYQEFGLTKDRSVYYNKSYAIRFSQASKENFSNTVLALSNLQKYDSRPFLVCIVCPHKNYLLLCNSTFLKKVSHSSQSLSLTNIKGSFNGSDIMRTFESIENKPENFERLFLIHEAIGFEDNLSRLVDATNSIIGTGQEFTISNEAKLNIIDAPRRAMAFVESQDFSVLKDELDEKVEQNTSAILIASLIENGNVRGRVIEYLVAGKNEALREQLIQALQENRSELPRFSTKNSLGDYRRIFNAYTTETDIKTKIMVLDSNPKAYNIDKMLEFLSKDKSVFMFYFIGIDPIKICNTVLVSMFDQRLVKGTFLLKHWAGRNSRGVTQLEGKTIKDIINESENNIDLEEAGTFIQKMIGT